MKSEVICGDCNRFQLKKSADTSTNLSFASTPSGSQRLCLQAGERLCGITPVSAFAIDQCINPRWCDLTPEASRRAKLMQIQPINPRQIV